MIKVPKEKRELICELYSQGKGIVEIARETKTYSNNVRKIVVERFGELPKKCKMDKDTFDKRVKAIHPHLDVISYEHINTKAKFYCNIHEFEFERYCKNVLDGTDCPRCKEGRKVVKPPKEKKERVYQRTPFQGFLERAREKFGDKFEYKDFESLSKHLTVICPEHGESRQTGFVHLNTDYGCKLCAQFERRLTHEQFLEKANKIHNNRYTYLNEYVMNDTIIKAVCPKHGEFEVLARAHLSNKTGCTKCTAYASKQELLYVEMLLSYGKKVEQHNKKILKGREIDILVDGKIGIELNGLLFHREGNVKIFKNKGANDFKPKNKTYHLEKTDAAAEKGVKLYQIFDSEYIKNPELVKHKILNACGLNSGVKINARNCEIRVISFNDSADFLKKYHIQGGDTSPVRYGAFIKDSSGEFSIMVGVMTFKKGKVDGEWDLNRFATDYGYHVRGLASKMLKRFERDYSPSILKTFADIRWTPKGDDNLYTKLGFDLVEKQPPVYHYFHPREPEVLYNRLRFQKHKILEKHSYLDPEMTEKHMMEFLGYDRVWDCGNWKFIKKYL